MAVEETSSGQTNKIQNILTKFMFLDGDGVPAGLALIRLRSRRWQSGGNRPRHKTKGNGGYLATMWTVVFVYQEIINWLEMLRPRLFQISVHKLVVLFAPLSSSPPSRAATAAAAAIINECHHLQDLFSERFECMRKSMACSLIGRTLTSPISKTLPFSTKDG